MGLGKIFGGTEKTTTETKSGVRAPSWFSEAEQDAFDLAQEISERPYEAYSGERLAGFTPDQLAAQEAVRGMQGKFDPYVQDALTLSSQQAANALAGGPSASQLERLTNPYQQNVTDIAKREATRDADIARQRLTSKQTAQSAFGGSRGALQQAELERNLQQGLQDTQYRGSADAYDRAMNQYNIGQNQLQQAITGSLGAAQGAQGVGYRDIGSLTASGAQQQLQGQGELDQAFQEYLEEKNYDIGRYGLKQQALGGVNTGLFERYGTTTQTTPGSGWLQKGIGAAAAIGGMMTGNPMAMMGGMSSLGGAGGAGTSPAPMPSMPGGQFGGGYSSINPSSGFGGGISWFKDGGHVSPDRKYANGGSILGTSMEPSLYGDKSWQSNSALGGLFNWQSLSPTMVESTELDPSVYDIAEVKDIPVGTIEEAVDPSNTGLSAYDEVVNKARAAAKLPTRIEPTQVADRSAGPSFNQRLSSPLTQMGFALLGSNKPFFQAVGEAGRIGGDIAAQQEAGRAEAIATREGQELNKMRAEQIRKELEDPEYRAYKERLAGRASQSEAGRSQKARIKAAEMTRKEIESNFGEGDFDQIFKKYMGILSQETQAAAAPTGQQQPSNDEVKKMYQRGEISIEQARSMLK